MFLTKEGILTESITHVYVSEDKEYYHTNASIVKVYENFNIKDDSDVYVEFTFDSKFISINNLKPNFFHWDRSCEMYVELSEYDIENYLY